MASAGAREHPQRGQDTENNPNFDAVSNKRANYDEGIFLKNIPKLIIFGTIYIAPFKHLSSIFDLYVYNTGILISMALLISNEFLILLTLQFSLR